MWVQDSLFRQHCLLLSCVFASQALDTFGQLELLELSQTPGDKGSYIFPVPWSFT